MSFKSDLQTYIKEYTNFKVGSYTITVPYLLSAKNTPDAILEAIEDWKGSNTKTKSQIQTWVDSNKSSTGVDCSGLVYYVLNEATGGAVREYFENKLKISLPYAYSVSAANLTGTTYGTKITAAKDVVPGCTINWSSGGHVLVVRSVTTDTNGAVDGIYYAHSYTTAHTGYITIADEDKDLNYSGNTWVDTNSKLTDDVCKSKYSYTLLLDPVADFV